MAKWEQTYLLSSTINGKVSLASIWSPGQSVHAGEVVLTLIPNTLAKTNKGGKLACYTSRLSISCRLVYLVPTISREKLSVWSLIKLVCLSLYLRNATLIHERLIALLMLNT